MKYLAPVGSFVLVPFVGSARQIAHVTGHTRTGRVKVRAWNATRSRWMPNTRTLDADTIISLAPEGEKLPAPPAIQAN